MVIKAAFDWGPRGRPVRDSENRLSIQDSIKFDMGKQLCGQP